MMQYHIFCLYLPFYDIQLKKLAYLCAFSPLVHVLKILQGTGYIQPILLSEFAIPKFWNNIHNLNVTSNVDGFIFGLMICCSSGIGPMNARARRRQGRFRACWACVSTCRIVLTCLGLMQKTCDVSCFQLLFILFWCFVLSRCFCGGADRHGKLSWVLRRLLSWSLPENRRWHDKRNLWWDKTREFCRPYL